MEEFNALRITDNVEKPGVVNVSRTLRKFHRYSREKALELRHKRESDEVEQKREESQRQLELQMEMEREEELKNSASYDPDPGEFEARHYTYSLPESRYHDIFTLEAAKAVVNHQNETISDEDKRLSLVTVVFCTIDFVAGSIYRIAFEAMEVGSGITKLYQAKCWRSMVMDHFFMFREAPSDVRQAYYDSWYYQSSIKKIRRAVATIEHFGISGSIYFTQIEDDPTIVSGKIYGLQPGVHCLHIHAFGDMMNHFVAIGSHLSFTNEENNASKDQNCRALGLKLHVVRNGSVTFFALDNDKQITLFGPGSIIGRAVVVHPIAEDLGCVVRDGRQLRLAVENSGQRIACGVIGLQLDDCRGLKYTPQYPPRPFTYYSLPQSLYEGPPKF